MSDAASVIVDFPIAPVTVGGNVESAGLFDSFAGVTIPASTNRITTTGKSTVGIGTATYIADSLADATLATNHPRFVKADAAGRRFRLLPQDGSVPVAAGIASTDTDDNAAVVAASNYAKAVGAKVVHLDPSRTWNLGSSNWPVSGYGGQILRTAAPGVVIDTRGAVIRGAAGTATAQGISYCGDINPSVYMTVTAAIAEGDKTIHVDNASLATVGSWVLYRLGSVTYDTPESYNWGMALVTARDTGANTVTLNKAMHALTAPDLAAAIAANKILQPLDPMPFASLGDYHFDLDLSGGYTGANVGLQLAYLYGAKIGNVSGRALGNGVYIQYCENFEAGTLDFSDTHILDAETGNVARIAESRGYIRRIISTDTDRTVLALEGSSDITVDEVIDHNYSATTRALLQGTGNSHQRIKTLFVRGTAGQTVFNPVEGTGTVENLVVEEGGALPGLNYGSGQQITQSVTVRNPDRTTELYLVGMVERWPLRIDLKPSLSDFRVLTPPNRIIVGAEVYVSSGATGITTLNVQRDGTGGVGTFDLAALISAGNWEFNAPVLLSHPLNATQAYRNGGGFYVNYATSGAAATGKFIDVVLLTIPNVYAPTGTAIAQATSNALKMFERPIVLAPCTVAQLPTASSDYQGARGMVTDATVTTFASTVAGGGANKVPVLCDGTNWIIG